MHIFLPWICPNAHFQSDASSLLLVKDVERCVHYEKKKERKKKVSVAAFTKITKCHPGHSSSSGGCRNDVTFLPCAPLTLIKASGEEERVSLWRGHTWSVALTVHLFIYLFPKRGAVTGRCDGMSNFTLSLPKLGAIARWCASVQKLRGATGKMTGAVHFAGSAQREK